MRNLKSVFARVRQSQAARGIAAVGALAATGAANAAIDVTAITTQLTDVQTAVTSIGLAVLMIHVGVKLYKWIRTAL